jgi:hypothetical protein
VSNGGTPASASWEWLVEGYRRALARFDETAHQRERKKRFIPLFETLNWAVAIMDFDRRLWSDEVVVGLRFARNSVHHQLSEALEPRDEPNPLGSTVVGGQPRTVGPPTVLEWLWRPADQLPKPPRRHRDAGYREGKKAYEDLLEGEPVANALAHLNSLL